MKGLLEIITVMLCFVMALCPNIIIALTPAPEGYKTFELTGFQVSVPDEFNKSEGWSSESTISLNSDACHVWEDGEEYSSSATINAYDYEGNVTDLNEYAQNMLWSVKAMDETCDEPVVEGNTIILRSTSEVGDGYLINWRFLVVNEDGKIAGGTISYRGEETKFYEGIVIPIIQSIQFK